MFFVFNFLVFAYFTQSEINCFTQRSIRTTNYVREHEEISNLRDAAPFKETNHEPNKFKNDLKSNLIDKLLTDEMLSAEQKYTQKDTSKNPLTLSSKHHLLTPTGKIKQKWPMFKYMYNKVNDEIKNQHMSSKIINEDAYSDPSPNSKIISKLKLEANKLVDDTPNNNKLSWLENNESSDSMPQNNKVIEMRSTKEKCKCKKMDPSSPCKCSGTSHNKKRCTHATPIARAHECSRYGPVTNHSCGQVQPLQNYVSSNPQVQPLQNYVSSNPYSFYPVIYPYSFYTISYPQPNLISDLKVPRKYKHKCRKHSTRFDDLYYEDNGRKPYDDNEYYHDSKRESTKGIVYDVNQDALIKEIVKDLKIHNNKDFVKECYCDSCLSTCSSNILVVILTLLCFIF